MTVWEAPAEFYGGLGRLTDQELLLERLIDVHSGQKEALLAQLRAELLELWLGWGSFDDWTLSSGLAAESAVLVADYSVQMRTLAGAFARQVLTMLDKWDGRELTDAIDEYGRLGVSELDVYSRPIAQEAYFQKLRAWADEGRIVDATGLSDELKDALRDDHVILEEDLDKKFWDRLNELAELDRVIAELGDTEVGRTDRSYSDTEQAFESVAKAADRIGAEGWEDSWREAQDAAVEALAERARKRIQRAESSFEDRLDMLEAAMNERAAEYAEQLDAEFAEREARLQERVSAVADTDMQLTERDEMARVYSQASGYKGLRRVVHPELAQTGFSCGLCYVAATQVYKQKELAAIHAECNCSTLPVFENLDPGDALNRNDLQRAYERAGSTLGQDLRDVRVRIEENGELGPVLRYDDDEFKKITDETRARAEEFSPDRISALEKALEKGSGYLEALREQASSATTASSLDAINRSIEGHESYMDKLISRLENSVRENQ